MAPRSRNSNKGKILLGKWRIVEKVGSGGFGTVYKVENVRDITELAAAKLEKTSGRIPSLHFEYQFYQQFSRTDVGFPKAFKYGDTLNGTHKAILMNLLGPSLESLSMKRAGLKFSTKTVLMIAIQGLARIERFHNMDFVHRDVKPANILIGRRDPHTIYFADFGIAKRFKTYDHRSHIGDNGGGSGFAGTIPYASINVHKGMEATRRDDLESFGYSLLELLKGDLPWTDMSGSPNGTKKIKMRISVRELCKETPDSFRHYMRYVRGLKFSERPKYDFLRELFTSALDRRGNKYDKKFDWISEHN